MIRCSFLKSRMCCKTTAMFCIFCMLQEVQVKHAVNFWSRRCESPPVIQKGCAFSDSYIILLENSTFEHMHSEGLHIHIHSGRILNAILLESPSSILVQLLLIHRPVNGYPEDSYQIQSLESNPFVDHIPTKKQPPWHHEVLRAHFASNVVLPVLPSHTRVWGDKRDVWCRKIVGFTWIYYENLWNKFYLTHLLYLFILSVTEVISKSCLDTFDRRSI